MENKFTGWIVTLKIEPNFDWTKSERQDFEDLFVGCKAGARAGEKRGRVEQSSTTFLKINFKATFSKFSIYGLTCLQIFKFTYEMKKIMSTDWQKL
jgi:hypothetical protein